MNTTQSQSPSVRVFGRHDVHIAKRHTAKLLARAAANQKAGNRKSVRHMAVEHLRSHHARLLGARRAYYALDRDDRPAIEQVAEVIKSLDAWQKSNEEVVVTAKWKDNGEYRLSQISDLSIAPGNISSPIFSVQLRYCTLANMAPAAGYQQLLTVSPNFYALAMAGPLNWTLPIAFRASRGRTYTTSFLFRRR